MSPLPSSSSSGSPGSSNVPVSGSGGSASSNPISSASVPPSSASSISQSPSQSSSAPAPPSSASSIPNSTSSVATASSSSPIAASSASSLAVSSSDTPSLTTLTNPSQTTSQSALTLTTNGQTITTFVLTTATIPAGSTVSASSSSHASSHTGAIVSGVIGAVAFLGIIAGAFLWYRRYQRKQGQMFDGNFDPVTGGGGTRPVSSGPEMIAHTTGGTLPRMAIDVDDDGMGGRLPDSIVGGGIVTPFTYTPTASAYDASTRSQSPPMSRGSPPPLSQYSQEGYPPTLSSAGGYYTAVPQQPQAAGGYYPPAASSSSNSSVYHPRSAKEREGAAARGAPLSVANPSPDGETGSSSAHNEQYQAYLRSGPSRYSQPQGVGSSNPPLSPTTSASGVIVHQDGGRVEPPMQEVADEIPPTYDSIPSEEKN